MVKVGSPVRQIVETAKEGQFDLIIMGTHGHGKMAVLSCKNREQSSVSKK
jgi:nucleotide-binding universal stress UspA family protein